MHWGDIAIHGGIALGIVVTFGLVGWHWFAATFASIGFLGREEIQGFEKYAAWLAPWHWSAQKLMEGFVPVAVAIAIAVIWRGAIAGRRPRRPATAARRAYDERDS